MITHRMIPPDSALHSWVTQFFNMETHVSFQIVTGLAVIGCALKRHVFIDLNNAGRIWPNLSVLLLAPSGEGKDTSINLAHQTLDRTGVSRWIRGKTIEAVKMDLKNIGNPAAGYILASEMKSFFGGKDYQQGMITELTDLLSNNERVDITLKSDLSNPWNARPQTIHRPTITLFGGSTIEWFHKLPEGTLEGGFVGRTLPVNEGRCRDQIPFPGPQTLDERRMVRTARDRFDAFLLSAATTYRAREETSMMVTMDAKDYYANWYMNRWRTFPPSVHAYAKRVRGTMYQLALLMAVSRGHDYVDIADMEFADNTIAHTARTIEAALIVAPREYEIAQEIIPLLPATQPEVIRRLRVRHPYRSINEAISSLILSQEIRLVDGTLVRA